MSPLTYISTLMQTQKILIIFGFTTISTLTKVICFERKMEVMQHWLSYLNLMVTSGKGVLISQSRLKNSLSPRYFPP